MRVSASICEALVVPPLQPKRSKQLQSGSHTTAVHRLLPEEVLLLYMLVACNHCLCCAAAHCQRCTACPAHSPAKFPPKFPPNFTPRFSLEEAQELRLRHALAVDAHVHGVTTPDGLWHSSINQRIHAGKAGGLRQPNSAAHKCQHVSHEENTKGWAWWRQSAHACWRSRWLAKDRQEQRHKTIHTAHRGQLSVTIS